MIIIVISIILFMKQLRNVGIASIISIYLMSCAPNKFIKKSLNSEGDTNTKIENTTFITQKSIKNIEYTAQSRINKRIAKYYSDPKFMKNLFHKDRSTSEILYFQKEGTGRMEFMPGSSYTLDDCLKGNYIMTALPAEAKKPRIVMTYFTDKGDVYQQAFFGYDINRSAMLISVVEKDNNLDGILDMMLSRDHTTNNLKLNGVPKQDYSLVAYVTAPLLDKYFNERSVYEKKQD